MRSLDRWQTLASLLSEACERFGIKYDTAAQAVRVSSAIESCLRRQHLSWHHHKEVANHSEAVELLHSMSQHDSKAQRSTINMLRAQDSARAMPEALMNLPRLNN